MLKITKKGDKAWVTFSMTPQEEKDVYLCGEWSDWDEESMKVKKSGERYLTKVLKCDETYQFGYKVEGHGWECDSETECIDSPFGSKNSLLVL